MAANLPSPSEAALITPSSEATVPFPSSSNREYGGKEADIAGEGVEKVRMKKQLGLLEGIAIIIGIIIGSGIFISPKGVIQEVDSVGASLMIWIMCGLLSMIGALCYAELGTLIPKSGGDYAYILDAYGSLPAFLYLWDAMMIFVPSTNAIMGLTFASYVLKPFFPEDCKIPQLALQLLAGITICSLTLLNSYDVKTTTRLQNVIMFTKIMALILVTIVGIAYMAQGHVENFDEPFEGTSESPGKFAVAFYSGIYSYAGWNYLNFMTEELKEPFKNLPRAIYISLPLVTAVYVLANIAYLAVLTPAEMVASEAIAVSFGEKVIGRWAMIIPVLVAIPVFGGLSVHIMATSRVCFVGARNGHMPAFLSHINIYRLTPVPSLVFLCVLSIIYLLVSDVYTLITYSSIVETFFITLSVSVVLFFRYKRPHMERPIKIPLWIPIVYVIVCIFLLIFPCYVATYEVLMGLLITVLGIPVYFICIAWKKKPVWFQNLITKWTHGCQKFFMAAKEDKD